MGQIQINIPEQNTLQSKQNQKASPLSSSSCGFRTHLRCPQVRTLWTVCDLTCCNVTETIMHFYFFWVYLKASLQPNKMWRKQNSLTAFRSQPGSLFFICECGPAPCPESNRKLSWLSFVCTVCLSLGTTSHSSSSSRARGSKDSRIDNNTLEGWTRTITLRSKVGYSKWLGFLVLILFQCCLIWNMEGWLLVFCQDVK